MSFCSMAPNDARHVQVDKVTQIAKVRTAPPRRMCTTLRPRPRPRTSQNPADICCHGKLPPLVEHRQQGYHSPPPFFLGSATDALALETLLYIFHLFPNLLCTI